MYVCMYVLPFCFKMVTPPQEVGATGTVKGRSHRAVPGAVSGCTGRASLAIPPPAHLLDAEVSGRPMVLTAEDVAFGRSCASLTVAKVGTRIWFGTVAHLIPKS